MPLVKSCLLLGLNLTSQRWRSRPELRASRAPRPDQESS